MILEKNDKQFQEKIKLRRNDAQFKKLNKRKSKEMEHDLKKAGI